MAQAGFTSLQLYYSTTVAATPSAGNLVAGELAINITDGKLFYEDNLGAVQVIAAKLPTAGLAYSSGSAWSPYSTSGTGTTVALTTSPAFTTPSLGVATATSINNVSINPVVTAATLSIANNKVFTVNRTLTLTGTDLTTMTFPSTDATIARTDDVQTFTNTQTFNSDLVVRSLTVGRGNGTGTNCSAFGINALAANTGQNNTAIGSSTLTSNVSGTQNTAVGVLALNATTGDDNVAVGVSAGVAITSGARNVIVGNVCDASAATGDDQVVIGYSLVGKGNDTAYIGGTNGAYNEKNVTTWETTSDARLKKKIVDNHDGLAKIEAIRVRNFEYRTADEITELPKAAAVNKASTQLGVIAQEMLPECVSATSEGVLSVNTDPLIWYLINAVKQLSAEVAALKAK
jgi:hypothetical protein